MFDSEDTQQNNDSDLLSRWKAVNAEFKKFWASGKTLSARETLPVNKTIHKRHSRSDPSDSSQRNKRPKPLQ